MMTYSSTHGVNLSHVKQEWVAPALDAMGLNTPARLNLVTGIGLVESGYVWLKQLNQGPAKGFWQMEPFTHDDLWKNSLIAPCRSRVAHGLRELLYHTAPSATQLITNPLYAAAMCAVKIWIAPQALPDANDAAALSAYHKRWYNSPLGAANPTVNIPAFQRAIAA